MPRYRDVHFEFLSARHEPLIHRGTVITRDKEMVLELECVSNTPYLIRGKDRGTFFEGEHEGHPQDDPVHAKWTRLDDMWVGTWIEAGADYLFTFRLTVPS